MITHKFKAGDTVRCISRAHTPWAWNLRHIQIGNVYTVSGITERLYGYNVPIIMLKEVDINIPDRPYFYEDDFDFASGSNMHGDPNEAWDRAMKGL